MEQKDILTIYNSLLIFAILVLEFLLNSFYSVNTLKIKYMPQYTEKYLEIEDYNEIVNLFKISFNRENNVDFFKWKYFDNPHGKAIVSGIYDKDILIASGAMIPEKFNYNNEQLLIYKCTDLMVHPLYQKQGLASRINKKLKQIIIDKNTPFIYTLCSKKATPSFVKNGWKNIGDLTNYFKPIQLIKFLNIFRIIANTTVKYYDNIDLLKEYNFNNSNEDISLNKSYDFFIWKTNNPNYKYGILLNIENGEVNGYLIFSYGQANILNIIDIDSNNKKTAKKLLKTLESKSIELKARGIIGIAYSQSALKQILIKNGYFKNPFKFGPLVSNADLNHNNLNFKYNIENKNRWNIYAINFDDI